MVRALLDELDPTLDAEIETLLIEHVLSLAKELPKTVDSLVGKSNDILSDLS